MRPWLFCAPLLVLLAAVRATPRNVACDEAPQSSYPMCDTTLPLDTRVDDLMSRLSDAEVIQQTCATIVHGAAVCRGRWRRCC
jgi:hypothetical protein